MGNGPGEMERFWDARARERAAYFVDNELAYGRPDMEQFWAGGPAIVDAVLARLGVTLEPHHRVVEIGCGIGRLTQVLAERARWVSAFDVSREMLQRAAELHVGFDNIEWLHGDGVSLAPLEEACADACFSWVVFQHFPDPAITLGYVREMGRILRDGGWAAFQVSNDPAVHRRPRKRVTGLLKAFMGLSPKGGSDAAWLGSSVDLGELRATAARSNLEVERIDGEGTQFCLVLLRRERRA